MSAADIVNEVMGSAWNLYHLLAMLDDQMLEMPHDRDGDRPGDMDRVSAVVRIARDEAKAIALKCGGDAGQVAS